MRRLWPQARRRIEAGLRDLRETVHRRCASQPDRADIERLLDLAIADMRAAMDEFERPLTALLDRLDGAVPQARTGDIQQRHQVLVRLKLLLADAPRVLPDQKLVALLDANGFVSLDSGSTLRRVLHELSHQLPYLEV
ncbi:hypothetical protein CDN99_07685 [Roseateles aquatilis]|uniref:Uncharacterized protein n=1 Tax=Roseateles aquatilis TaxID=431061 RepID=A0A246JI73_9BURK|nr:hypothetical protein [Roseateles aquatilis]OWQ92213.1 hypothetical protein CDN99_07685 [Roseateles aquatilis]